MNDKQQTEKHQALHQAMIIAVCCPIVVIVYSAKKTLAAR